MIQARCAYGVALDMNAGHSGLEFYRVLPHDEFKPLGRHMDGRWEREGKVPKMEGWTFRARRLIKGMGLMHFPRYIKREGRDYFYLTLRYVLPGEPLTEGVPWQVKGLPQHGFPYALARAEHTLSGGAKVRVLKIDPRMIGAGADHAAGAVVAAINPPPGDAALWLSDSAFMIGSEPAVEPAFKVAGGATSSDTAAAACGVGDADGMGIYIEVIGEERAPAAELRALLAKMGSSSALYLLTPLPIALGGDTNLADQAVRLPESDDRLLLRRRPGPASKRIFETTPIVPFKEWFPLQARRIRYFKKPKKKDS